MAFIILMDCLSLLTALEPLAKLPVPMFRTNTDIKKWVSEKFLGFTDIR